MTILYFILLGLPLLNYKNYHNNNNNIKINIRNVAGSQFIVINILKMEGRSILWSTTAAESSGQTPSWATLWGKPFFMSLGRPDHRVPPLQSDSKAADYVWTPSRWLQVISCQSVEHSMFCTVLRKRTVGRLVFYIFAGGNVGGFL